jgi:nucleoside-diphosphate-sugar epimerase
MASWILIVSLANHFTAQIIQISGAIMVSQDEIKAKNFGNGTDGQYSDIRDEKELYNSIRKHQNRTVDNYVLDIAEQTPNVKTALVIPSLIYGKGNGPGNQRSIQAPELARITLERKRAVKIGAGANIWSNIHISDLGSILVHLVESAISGSDDKQIWGTNGLFLAGTHPGISFGSLVKQIAETAHKCGLIPGVEVNEISAAEADKLSPHASAIVGTNARTLSERAQKALGWSAEGPSLEDEIPPTVAIEAGRMRLTL